MMKFNKHLNQLNNSDKIKLLRKSISETLVSLNFDENEIQESVDLLINNLKSNGTVYTGVSKFK